MDQLGRSVCFCLEQQMDRALPVPQPGVHDRKIVGGHVSLLPFARESFQQLFGGGSVVRRGQDMAQRSLGEGSPPDNSTALRKEATASGKRLACS
jgi:hypothetical protein